MMNHSSNLPGRIGSGDARDPRIVREHDCRFRSLSDSEMRGCIYSSAVTDWAGIRIGLPTHFGASSTKFSLVPALRVPITRLGICINFEQPKLFQNICFCSTYSGISEGNKNLLGREEKYMRDTVICMGFLTSDLLYEPDH
jgi:hypothetical protein